MRGIAGVLGLAPMVLTLISVDIPRSRELWRRSNADAEKASSTPIASD